MEPISVIIVGGGGHARVVADCLLANGTAVAGFFDNDGSKEVLGLKWLGEYDTGKFKGSNIIVAIGNNAVRKRICDKEVKHAFTTAIHPSVIFSKYATVQEGSMILHGAIVQANARIGRHVIANTGSRIDHDCVIGDFVHIAPGAVLCGNVSVGENTLIGAGATVLPGTTIGKGCTVGAGAVVVRDLPDFAVAVGNPAKIIRHNE